MITAPRLLVESTQFQNQRIGVVRAYQGGAAERGRAASAQALMQGADEIAGLAFRYAAEDAEQQGLEMAQSAQRASVMAIDPATGEPVAMSQMGGMGRIGSEAYRRVINTRFQQNIEEEIRNRAAVLAEQYGNDPDGIGLYTTAMSDYISSMSENATGQWRSFIEDTGTSYVNRTRAAMTVSQMRASRSQMAAAGERARSEALSAIRAGAAAGGFSSAPPSSTSVLPTGGFASAELSFGATIEGELAAPEFGSLPMGRTDTSPIALGFGGATPSSSVFPEGSFTAAIDQSVRAGITDEIDAQIVDPSVMADWDRRSMIAGFEGAVEYYVSNLDPTDPESQRHLDALESAISSNNVPAFMRLAPQLRSFAPFLMADRGALDDVRQAVDGLLTNAADFAGFASEGTVLERERQARRLEFSLQADAEQSALSITDYLRQSLIAGDTQGAVMVFSRTLPQLQGMLDASANAATEEEGNAITQRLNTIRDGILNGVVRGLSAGRGQDEIRLIQSRLLNEDIDAMSPSERAAYRLLVNLRPYGADVFDDVQSQLSTIHGTAAAGQDILNQEAGYDFTRQNILPALQDIRSSDLPGINDIHAAAIGALDNTPLSDSDRARFRTDFDLAAAHSSTALAMELAAQYGPEQVNLAQQYAEFGGAPPAGLARPVAQAMEQAIRYGDLSGQETFVRNTAGVLANTQLENLANERARVERTANIAMTIQGNGTASTADGRRIAQDALNRLYQGVQIEQQRSGMPPMSLAGASGPFGTQPVEQLPIDFWQNPEYLNDPVLSEVQRRASNIPNFMPESLLTSFKTAASGAPVQNLPTLMVHWRRFGVLEYGGTTVINPAIAQSMSDSEIAMMNMYTAAEPFYGSEGLIQAASDYSRFMAAQDAGSLRQMAVGTTPMSEFLTTIDGWNSYSPELQSAVAAVATRMNEFSIATGGQRGQGESWLRGELETLVDQLYPDSQGIVMQPDSMGGLTSRTAYPLERELGPQDSRRFLGYIEAEVLREAGITISFMNRPAGADEPVSLELRGFVETQTGQEIRPTQRNAAFLVPYGRDQLGGVAYAVMVTNPQTLEPIPLIRQDGLGPYIYSTNEGGFRSVLEADIDQLELIRQGRVVREDYFRRLDPNNNLELGGIQ